jgi:hypothetical protein
LLQFSDIWNSWGFCIKDSNKAAVVEEVPTPTLVLPTVENIKYFNCQTQIK